MSNRTDCLYLFYEEPDPDRWIKYDRYPRRHIRRLFRGPEPIGGVKRWFLNLIKGLDKIGQEYRINDYKSLKKDPNLWALVVGKPHVIEKIPANTNIIFGPAVSAHPYDNDFWHRKPNIKHLLISCSWFKEMYEQDLPVSIPISVWPSGIDLDIWKPISEKIFSSKVLIYDKIRWDHDKYNKELLEPIKRDLKAAGIHMEYIRYGSYKEEDFKDLLKQVDAMIFLCEHETQGFAYLQTLASGVPILAWDRGGYWQDPSMYPHRVQFSPVTSVPYWGSECGEKFLDYNEFKKQLPIFWTGVKEKIYSPAPYIQKNFKLEDRSSEYVQIVTRIQRSKIGLQIEK